MEERKQKRKHQEYILLTYIPWDRRRMIMVDMAKERMQEHPNETLGESFAVIEAEYYSAINANRFNQPKPFNTTYGLKER